MTGTALQSTLPAKQEDKALAVKMERPDSIPDGDLKTQYGALCYRVRKGKVQVLMITSRRTKRWIVPKGWPIDKVSASDTAATEAWEEAGVVGAVGGDSIGFYTYVKEGENGAADVSCATLVYPLRVKSLKNKFPERRERRRKWMSRKKAAAAVWEPELAALIKSFKPA